MLLDKLIKIEAGQPAESEQLANAYAIASTAYPGNVAKARQLLAALNLLTAESTK